MAGWMDRRMHEYEDSVLGALRLTYILVLSPCVMCTRVYVLKCVRVCALYMYSHSMYMYLCIYMHIVWFVFLLFKYIYTFGLVMRQTTKKRNYTLCEHLYGKRLRNLILPKHSSFILILNADLLDSRARERGSYQCCCCCCAPSQT